MELRPGTPRLLRELNDRAALELLLTAGPMTRAQLGARTGLSKVTASQLLSRLTERGLVEVAGEQAGGRGPNAALYAVVSSAAYVAGLHVELDEVSAGVADVTGRVVSQISVDPNETGNPVDLVRGAVVTACGAAGLSPDSLRAFVIGTPGVLDPRTGDLRLAVNLPAWHEGVLDALRSDLGRPVTIENDVNLAAMAERSVGAAQGVDDFVLVWIGVGLGLATVLNGRLHRGVGGAAGEIGYLPVPGVPLPQDITHPATGAFQSLVGAQAVLALAASHGFTGQLSADGPGGPAVAGGRAGVAGGRAGAAGGRAGVAGGRAGVAGGVASVSGVAGGAVSASGVAGGGVSGSGLAGRVVRAAAAAAAAGDGRGQEFLAELAGRVATGVAAISVVLDPGLVVLGGEVGLAGGVALASRVAAEVARISPARLEVVPTRVTGGPVLLGAIQAAVDNARAELLESVATLA